MSIEKYVAERTHLKTYADIPRQSRKQCSARPQIHSEYRDSCFPACRQSLATYLFVSPSLIVLSFSNLHALSISTLKYLRQKRKLIRRRPLSYLIWKHSIFIYESEVRDMKNKFGNRYTRAIATFHFHKFVQMFRRTFSLTLSFILFSCVRSGKQENTTRKRKHRPSFTELCNGQHGSATEQNHHLKRLSSEILIGENNFRYFARRKT